jgi:S-DNA-T family DNA segregation ATPase FtsK/SpoIIIE
MPRHKKNLHPEPKIKLSPETKKDIGVIVLFALAFLSLLSIFNLTGGFGRSLNSFWQLVFGWGWWVWPVILILIGYLVINQEKYLFKFINWLGFFVLIFSLAGLLQLFSPDKTFTAVKEGIGGGVIGYLVTLLLLKLASFWGALIILCALVIISLLLFFETSITALISKLKYNQQNKLTGWLDKIKENKQNKKTADYETEEVGFEQKNIEVNPDIEKNEIDENLEIMSPLEKNTELARRSLSEGGLQKKHYPRIDLPLDLLNSKPSKPTAGDIKANQEIIRQTLANFGLEVEMGSISIGPTVTQYAFKPASGVKVSQITTLSNDLALALAAHPIRIEAPIPGKSLIGIEVPNQKIALVTLKDVLSSDSFKKRSSNLMVALGKDVAGESYLADLDKMPHLLVAGATNSGKTVCLNSTIVSLLYQNQPDDLKFILVDPKQVEMTQYNGIPHLICPVITNVKQTVNSLRWTVQEMERRFEVLFKNKKRNIAAYNQAHPDEKMPYIIVVVDELADLMTVAAMDIEQAIIRLAQKSRAVGIHLILATQRPSVNIITGLIKANITSRIAFSVASGTDSRTILDHAGAEKLLGRGDMLFISAELSKPKRVQGAYLSDEEIENVVAYLKQTGEPEYDTSIVENQTSLGSGPVDGIFDDFGDNDELLPEAKSLVIKAGKASASYLQRRLRIGYARAARLLDLLEDQGVVGPADGARPREVLSAPEELEADEILANAEEGDTEDNNEILVDENSDENQNNLEEETRN